MGNLSLLIVRTGLNNLNSIVLMLLDAGHVVQCVDNAEDAIILLEKSPENYHIVMISSEVSNTNFIDKVMNNWHLQNLKFLVESKEEKILVSSPCSYFIDHKNISAIVNNLENNISNLKSNFDVLKKNVSSLGFTIKTLDEAKVLSQYLAEFCNSRDKIAIGLSEILLNAIEHGNLSISYDEKTKLHESGIWYQEINRRLDLPEFKDKRVKVNFHKTNDIIKIAVEDEGMGFDWQKYLSLDVGVNTDNHGRGILLARSLSFDRIEYKGKGNIVICTTTI